MATIQQVRDAMHRQPFRGFTVRLVDGRSYHVKHPDFISVPENPRGRNLVIHHQGTHQVDILLVVEIEEPEAPEEAGPAKPHAEGNGA
jgi:hypothetical protein